MGNKFVKVECNTVINEIIKIIEQAVYIASSIRIIELKMGFEIFNKQHSKYFIKRFLKSKNVSWRKNSK